MRPRPLCALLLLAYSFALRPAAQQQQPTFEVATVRPSKGSAVDGYWSLPGTGSFIAHSLTLGWLISLAFDVDQDQIANKPPWLASETFDVAAKPAEEVSLTREELRPRLQSLLRERFKLVTHTESRPTPGYLLTVARNGPKLQPTKGSRFPNYRVTVTDSELNGINWSMPYLASALQHAAGRPVLDGTGITGGYDLKLDFAPGYPTSTSLPSIFTALQETLGLQLRPQRIPVTFLVIDRVDQNPTEN